MAGDIRIDPTPREVEWTVPLDEDDEHATYDEEAVARYFGAATQAVSSSPSTGRPTAAGRHRSTPGGARFDLAVNLFAGEPADPPSDDFIMRNSMNAEDVAVGW